MKTDTDVLFSRKRTGQMDPTVNISKAVLICNMFHFFFAASKACLLPFLTIFLRLLGMSATETGVVIALKTITGFFWAPLWARCAISYNKRRFVLMCSVFMFAASYLSLTVLYQQTTHYKNCNNTGNENNRLIIPSFFEPLFNNSNELKPQTTPTIIPSPITTVTEPLLTSSTQQPTLPTVLSTKPVSSNVETSTSPTTTFSTTKTNQYSTSSDQLQLIVKDLISSMNLTTEKLNSLDITGQELYDMIHNEDPTLDVSVDEVTKLWNMLKNSTNYQHKPSRQNIFNKSSIHKRSVNITWNGTVDKGKQLWNNMQEEKLELFLIVLLVVIIGEFLSCSIEKVADDAWFDFLDRIDDLEKYGKQRLGGNFAFVIFPVLITLSVQFTDCLLPLDINHFLLHFYAFGGFLGITFVVSYFYPVPPPQKHDSNSKVMKGLKIICCDCQGLMYTLTLLIMGMIYASYHNYLFWLIQDLGGSELNMGMCVSIGALAEIPMLLLSQKMVKKMGNAGVVSLALILLSSRVLIYSFIPTPWAVMPAELLHAFTHTAMWFAILSYDDFNVGAMIDRSIRSVLSSVYFGVGFSAGCLISGLAYDLFGHAIMFQCASVIAGVWFFLFSIVSRCTPKKERIRYVKLLHAEDSDTDSIEDDWLEMALKEN
ncbi:hypothetical protein SNE40_020082 [Patella caerulea]|uniref:Major facilitator superfamily associated domain-containing protein n=1 Tax=Patella caerulea TaxID=87958 RepID=A0AAN8GJT6_PATCE